MNLPCCPSLLYCISCIAVERLAQWKNEGSQRLDLQWNFVDCFGDTLKIARLIERTIKIKNIISLFAASGVRGEHSSRLYRPIV